MLKKLLLVTALAFGLYGNAQALNYELEYYWCNCSYDLSDDVVGFISDPSGIDPGTSRNGTTSSQCGWNTSSFIEDFLSLEIADGTNYPQYGVQHGNNPWHYKVDENDWLRNMAYSFTSPKFGRYVLVVNKDGSKKTFFKISFKKTNFPDNYWSDAEYFIEAKTYSSGTTQENFVDFFGDGDWVPIHIGNYQQAPLKILDNTVANVGNVLISSTSTSTSAVAVSNVTTNTYVYIATGVSTNTSYQGSYGNAIEIDILGPFSEETNAFLAADYYLKGDAKALSTVATVTFDTTEDLLRDVITSQWPSDSQSGIGLWGSTYLATLKSFNDFQYSITDLYNGGTAIGVNCLNIPNGSVYADFTLGGGVQQCAEGQEIGTISGLRASMNCLPIGYSNVYEYGIHVAPRWILLQSASDINQNVFN